MRSKNIGIKALINEYEEDTSCGREISLCVAGTLKIIWMKPMKDDNFKLKFKRGKKSIQLHIFQTKKTNPEIFSVIPRLQCKMQSIQKKTYAFSMLDQRH